MDQVVMLTWHQFSANLQKAADMMKEKHYFTDVTLAAEDRQIEAHRFMLASSSAFFLNLLYKNPLAKPVIFLYGVKFHNLVSILDFIYCGQVQVEQSRLKEFLTVAEGLGIKGLCEDSKQSSEGGEANDVETGLGDDEEEEEEYEETHELTLELDDDDVLEVDQEVVGEEIQGRDENVLDTSNSSVIEDLVDQEFQDLRVQMVKNAKEKDHPYSTSSRSTKRTTKDPLKQQQQPFMVAIPSATLKEFTSPVPSSNEESCDDTEAIVHSQTANDDTSCQMADSSNVDTGSKVTEISHADTNSDSDTRKDSDTSADVVDTEPNIADKSDTDTVTCETEANNIAGNNGMNTALGNADNDAPAINCDEDLENIVSNSKNSQRECGPNVTNSSNREICEAKSDDNDDMILANTSETENVTPRPGVQTTEKEKSIGENLFTSYTDVGPENSAPPLDTILTPPQRTPSTRKRGRPGQMSGSRSATTRLGSGSKTRSTGKTSELADKSRTSPRKVFRQPEKQPPIKRRKLSLNLSPQIRPKLTSKSAKINREKSSNKPSTIYAIKKKTISVIESSAKTAPVIVRKPIRQCKTQPKASGKVVSKKVPEQTTTVLDLINKEEGMSGVDPNVQNEEELNTKWKELTKIPRVAGLLKLMIMQKKGLELSWCCSVCPAKFKTRRDADLHLYAEHIYGKLDV